MVVSINKKDLIILLSILASLTLGLLLCLKHDTLEIFPFSNPTETAINTSHEPVDSGFSISAFDVDKNGAVNFKYTLTNRQPEPMAALYFYKPDAPNLYFDFAPFNEITIDFSSQKGKRIPVYLTIDYQKLQTKQKELLSMPLVQVIDYKQTGKYTLQKEDFEIPSWWLRFHGLKRESIGDIDFSKVNYVLVNSCQTLGPGQEDIITVRSIAFTQNNTLNYVIYFALVFSTVLVFVVKYFFNKRKKVLVPYKMNDIQLNPNGTKIERILHYIGENYTNPELGITDIQLELGITTREIGTLIKDELNTSFKAYLNTIRLIEIKRLLLETDLPVSDIAYKMGYSNISHFNRVFKKELGLSPKEFRDAQGK